MSALVTVAVFTSLVVLAGFLAFLAFCAFVVVRTGSTAGLRDVPVAIRAFRGALSVRPRS